MGRERMVLAKASENDITRGVLTSSLTERGEERSEKSSTENY